MTLPAVISPAGAVETLLKAGVKISERALRFVPEGEDRPRQAIDTARRFARGEATSEEMAAVRVAAQAAADAPRAAGAAARAAAEAQTAERAEQERMLRAWLNT